jgi:cold shock CspA family protein
MRMHGTLARWNDERGFGFITPAKGPPDIFVHISAFPRDGVRPRPGELISFEIEAGPEGKSRAVRIMRPGQKAKKLPPVRQRQPTLARRAVGIVALLGMAGVGIYLYTQHARRALLAETPIPLAAVKSSRQPLPMACDGRTMCSQMTSCAEAKFFINNCPGTQMDGDGDGVPCESQWCN